MIRLLGAAGLLATVLCLPAPAQPTPLPTLAPPPSAPPSQRPLRLRYLLAGSLVLAGATWLVFAYHPRSQHWGRLEMQGLLLLKLQPGSTPELPEKSGLLAFQSSFAQFQRQLPALQCQLELAVDGLRIEMHTPRPLWVFQPGIPERLQQELQALLEPLSEQHWYVQLRLQGGLKGLRLQQQFVLVNHGLKVGLNQQTRSRFGLQQVVFHG